MKKIIDYVTFLPQIHNIHIHIYTNLHIWGGGTRNCYILATESNKQQSNHERLCFPLKCVNLIFMILCMDNKLKALMCKLKGVIMSKGGILCTRDNLEQMISEYTYYSLNILNINTCSYTGFIQYNVWGGQVNPDSPYMQSEVHIVPEKVGSV